MVITRLITATFLVLTFATGIFFFKEDFLKGVFLVLLISSIYEISRLRKTKTDLGIWMPYHEIILAVLTGFIVKSLGLQTFKLISLYWVYLIYQTLTMQNNNGALKMTWHGFFISVIGTFLLLIMHTDAEGFTWRHYVILQGIASLADTVAYIFGKIFKGKPAGIKASPGKTTVGFLSALVVTPLIATLIQNQLGWAFLSFWSISFLVPVSILGDLVFSYVKRLFGVKDYASYLPGHGGVLDRMDSFIVVVGLYFSFFYG